MGFQFSSRDASSAKSSMSDDAASEASASVIVSWNSSFHISMKSCRSASVNCILPTVPGLIAERKMHKPARGRGMQHGVVAGSRHFH